MIADVMGNVSTTFRFLSALLISVAIEPIQYVMWEWIQERCKKPN